jgi:hypothetical protein
MPALHTRAYHSGLDRTVVMPLEAVAEMPGWEPVGEPADDPLPLQAALEAENEAARREELIDAQLARVTEAAKAAAGGDGRTVDEVLADVGDDPDAARAALDVERAGKGRVSLVKKLTEIAAADTAGTDHEEG